MDILPQLLVNALITGSIYALCAAGLAISYGLLRILNFAHGHLMMTGAYFFFLWYVQLDLGLFYSALLTALCLAVVGGLTLYIFVLPFSRYSSLLPFVTTLALATILESVISMTFGVNVRSLTAGTLIESDEIYGVFITPIQQLIIFSAIGILFILGLIVHCTAVGRRIRALAQFTPGAVSIGISSWKTKFWVFVVAVLVAGYAGILVGFETNLQPTMGNAYTIKSFAAMVLGGLGNLWGTVAGSYILGLIENLSLGLEFGGYSLPAGYKDAFAYVVILLVLLFKPSGLFVRSGRRI